MVALSCRLKHSIYPYHWGSIPFTKSIQRLTSELRVAATAVIEITRGEEGTVLEKGIVVTTRRHEFEP